MEFTHLKRQEKLFLTFYIDLKSNEACFLQRLVELNLKDERNTSLIVYPLYTIVTEWYVENGDTRTLANLQVLQSKLNHPRQ